MTDLRLETALLAQLESARGHASEIKPYTLDSFLGDSANAIKSLLAEVERLRTEISGRGAIRVELLRELEERTKAAESKNAELEVENAELRNEIASDNLGHLKARQAAEAKVRELEKWQARVKEESDRVHDRFFELLRVAEKLRGRVAYHHQWHQANTDYDEEIGQSPADAYVESHQYDDDFEALKKYEAFVVKITGREEPSNE